MAKGSGNTRNGISSFSDMRKQTRSVKNANGFRQRADERQNANRRIAKIISDIQATGHPMDGRPFKVGHLPTAIVSTLKKVSKIVVKNPDVYMSSGSMTHHQTGTKQNRGKVVPITDFAKFASRIGKMDIYENRGGIIFTDYKNKFIVEVNRSIKIDRKSTIVCCHISSSKVIDKKEFSRYKPMVILKGKMKRKKKT